MADNAAHSASRKKIIFVHPDLGIGGAERLVIDAAVGLQSSGHKVTILTSYCNKDHCFEETKDGMHCPSPYRLTIAKEYEG